MSDELALAKIEKISAAEYKVAFREIREHMAESDLLMLKTHYESPDYDITATQLAYKIDFSSFAAANLRYGLLAGKLLEFFQIQFMSRAKLNILVNFHKQDGEWHWRLRPQVVQALTQLKWFGRKATRETILDENNYKQRIDAYTHQDWQPLMELIPDLETTSNFGESAGGEEVEEGIIQLPYFVAAPIVSRFIKIVYDLPIIISFDWGGWTEGRKIAGNKNFDLDTLDLPTKCKLITAIVRNDRFSEGALASAFESGLMLRILKSIEKQIAGTK